MPLDDEIAGPLNRIERQVLDDSGLLHARKRANAIQQVAIVAREPRRLTAPHRERQAGGKHPARGEAGIDGSQPNEAIEQQARAGDEHQREGDLRNDEQALHLLRLPRQARSRSGLDEVVDVRTRGAPCGQPSEQKAGRERHADAEGNNARIDGCLGATQQSRGQQRAKEINGPVG